MDTDVFATFISISSENPFGKKSLGWSPPPPLPAGVHLIQGTVQSWIRAGDLKRWIRRHALLLSEDGKDITGILNKRIS
ncbi:hypothetical protein JOB18_010943 [Solea senegalensis]|uniref:Uncharacterized protein n=1 Tax=Solea senegalensis TaxID=28829 RepID=A0AAV6RVX3_SOLSE|nr:hypothetical protein JOB18_010943 [Solea senegalensis]